MDVIIFGKSSDLDKILPLMYKEKLFPKQVVDSSPQKQGTCITVLDEHAHQMDLVVEKPKKILTSGIKTVVITASFFDSIYETISSILGQSIDEYEILVSPYAWLMQVGVGYDDALLAASCEYYHDHADETKKLYDTSDSDTSKILNFHLKRKMEDKTFEFVKYDEYKGLQYVEGYFYRQELNKYRDITFIDIGAYRGDTVKEMFGAYRNIRKYYAFEPDEENFEELSKVAAAYDNVEIIKEGLSNEKKTLVFGSNGAEFSYTVANKTNDEIRLDVRPLDSFKLDVVGKLVIKMDVEGAEPDVLEGGTEYIKKYSPVMAVCVYHKVEHLYSLAKWIKDVNPNYRLVLRSGIHTHLIAIPD